MSCSFLDEEHSFVVFLLKIQCAQEKLDYSYYCLFSAFQKNGGFVVIGQRPDNYDWLFFGCSLPRCGNYGYSIGIVCCVELNLNHVSFIQIIITNVFFITYICNLIVTRRQHNLTHEWMDFPVLMP